MNPSELASLHQNIIDLREPEGGQNLSADRFSNVAELDHEIKIQYKRVVIALEMVNPEGTVLRLQDIEQDFVDYGQQMLQSAKSARDVDRYGKTIPNATPISSEDQALYEQRCSELRSRVLDALLTSGHSQSEPKWLL